MAANDILCLLADAEIVPRIFAGGFRMAEPVQRVLMVFVYMPVVSVKIVQQGADNERTLIGTEMQPVVEPAAHFRDIFAML